MAFTGFPSRPQATAIPNVFFTDLLPQLTEPGELAVALCAFHAVSSKKGFPRYITKQNLLQEPAMATLDTQKVPNLSWLQGTDELPTNADVEKVPNELLRRPEAAKLQNNSATNPASKAAAEIYPRPLRERVAPAAPGEGPINTALARLVEIGMLLPLTVEQNGHQIDLYFLNAPADRRGLEAIRTGTVDIGVIAQARPAAAPQRSSIFALYESLVGTISPLIADELADAERLYPAPWLEGAFREAAAQNARSWRYVSRILERWAIEGPDHATTERSAAGDAGPGDDRYFRGKYGKILKQRLQP